MQTPEGAPRRRRSWSVVWRSAFLFCSLGCLSGLVPAACTSHSIDDPPRLSRRALSQYAWARGHLEAPWTGYGVTDDMGVGAFDLVLLSNLASGLMSVGTIEPERRDELAPLAAEVARRAMSAEASPTSVPAERMEIGDHNLYASHLLLILGIEHHFGVTEHDALATRLARHLRGRSLAEGADAHARSYPGSTRWPADQAVTLSALRLHDREHGTDLSARPIAAWLAWLSSHRTSGLPWSTTGALRYARIPRGCALSWTTTHMAQFAPDQGQALYARYRDAHGIAFMGWGGFREWPVGHDGGSDVDAGPVLLGWGTAATGIGLGASRLYGDDQRYAGIERIADTVGAPVPFSGRYLLAPTLGQAMLFSGETATFWFERPSAELARSESDWALGPMGLLAFVLAIDVWLIRGIARARRR